MRPPKTTGVCTFASYGCTQNRYLWWKTRGSSAHGIGWRARRGGPHVLARPLAALVVADVAGGVALREDRRRRRRRALLPLKRWLFGRLADVGGLVGLVVHEHPARGAKPLRVDLADAARARSTARHGGRREGVQRSTAHRRRVRTEQPGGWVASEPVALVGGTPPPRATAAASVTLVEGEDGRVARRLRRRRASSWSRRAW